MTDLASWLLEQIADDEAAARAAAHGGRWRYEVGDSIGAWTLYDEHWNIASMTTYDTESYNYKERLPAFRPPTYIDPDATGRHIARHDPARVLAECAAKRAVVEKCARDAEDYYASVTAVPVLRLLAQPYAGQAGWREEWRIT